MHVQPLQRQGQAQSGPPRLTTFERAQHAGGVFRTQSGALVEDLQPAVGAQHLHRAPGRGGLGAVLQQVDQGLVQQHGIGQGPALAGQGQRAVPQGRPPAHLGQRLAGHLLQLQQAALGFQRPGPLQEALHQPLQVIGLLQQAGGRFLVAGPVQQLAVALEHRQSVLQLMGHSGGHLAQFGEPLPQLPAPFFLLQEGDVLELQERAHPVRGLDALQAPAAPAAFAAPGRAGGLVEPGQQPGKGFQHKTGIQADDAGLDPQQGLPAHVQGGHLLPLIHPQDAERQRVQQALVHRAQLAQGCRQLAPLLQALRHRPQQQLLGPGRPRARPQLQPAHQEQSQAGGHDGQGQRKQDPDMQEVGVGHPVIIRSARAEPPDRCTGARPGPPWPRAGLRGPRRRASGAA